MPASTVAVFFALLLLGGSAGVLAVVLLPRLRPTLAGGAIQVGAAVAVGATAGSLYFSEIADFVPCELCWYQRIAMYPLAVILPMAAVRNESSVRPYAAVLAGAGLLVSLYHIQLQWFPEQGTFCDATNPCAGRWVEAFGWMTIPQMAGISFALILSLLALDRQMISEEE